MNLSPQWVQYLEGSGHDAVHWSRVGQPDAEDSVILEWARADNRIVLTSDLDFGAILALSRSSKPSIVQIRAESTLPAQIGVLVLEAIQKAEPDLISGALLNIEIGRARLRVLPFDRKS